MKAPLFFQFSTVMNSLVMLFDLNISKLGGFGESVCSNYVLVSTGRIEYQTKGKQSNLETLQTEQPRITAIPSFQPSHGKQNSM